MPDTSDGRTSSTASAPATGWGSLVARAKDLTGLVTVSGITAALYAIGYVALNRRAETLGLPETASRTGAYFRAGYFFFVDSAEALWRSMGAHPWITGALVASSLAAAVARDLPGRPSPDRRLTTIAGWLAATLAYGYALRAMFQNAAITTQTFEADGLLLREVGTLDELPEPALRVVSAIANGTPDTLYALYGEISSRTLAVGVVLVLAAFVVSRLPTGVPTSVLGYMKWLTGGALVWQFSLLPFLYGTCYLTKVPSCVGIRFTPAHTAAVVESTGAVPRVRGFLASELDLETTVIQVLEVRVPPLLHFVDRAHVDAVQFFHTCGSLLPGFQGREATGPPAGEDEPVAGQPDVD